jgi:hypothetical protein
LKRFPGGLAARIAAPLDEVLTLGFGTTAVDQFFKDVFILIELNFVGNGKVRPKVRDMNLLFNDPIFQVTQAVSATAIREYLKNAVRSGEEEFEFVGVPRNAAADAVANLKLDVSIRAANRVAHGIHLSQVSSFQGSLPGDAEVRVELFRVLPVMLRNVTHVSVVDEG